MQKMLVLLPPLLLTLSLSACSGDEPDVPPSPDPSAAVSESPATAKPLTYPESGVVETSALTGPLAVLYKDAKAIPSLSSKISGDEDGGEAGGNSAGQVSVREAWGLKEAEQLTYQFSSGKLTSYSVMSDAGAIEFAEGSFSIALPVDPNTLDASIAEDLDTIRSQYEGFKEARGDWPDLDFGDTGGMNFDPSTTLVLTEGFDAPEDEAVVVELSNAFESNGSFRMNDDWTLEISTEDAGKPVRVQLTQDGTVAYKTAELR